MVFVGYQMYCWQTSSVNCRPLFNFIILLYIRFQQELPCYRTESLVMDHSQVRAQRMLRSLQVKDVLWIFLQGEGDLLPLLKAKFFFHHQLEIFFQWKSSVIILVITSLPHSCIIFKIPLKVSLNLKGCVLKARTHICDVRFVVNDHNIRSWRPIFDQTPIHKG